MQFVMASPGYPAAPVNLETVIRLHRLYHGVSINRKRMRKQMAFNKNNGLKRAELELTTAEYNKQREEDRRANQKYSGSQDEKDHRSGKNLPKK
jgi:hypothetical protein